MKTEKTVNGIKNVDKARYFLKKEGMNVILTKRANNRNVSVIVKKMERLHKNMLKFEDAH